MNFGSSGHTGRRMYGNFGFYPDEIHATFLISVKASLVFGLASLSAILTENGRPSTAQSTFTFDSTRVVLFTFESESHINDLSEEKMKWQLNTNTYHD